MNIIWFGLVVYAVIEAIAAAGRVRRKRRASTLHSTPQLNRHSERQSLEQQGPEQQSLKQQGPEQQNHPSVPQPDAVAQPPFLAESIPGSTEPSTSDLPDLVPADLDLPLAVSVSVTELTQAHPEPAAVDLDLVPPELALPIEPTTEPSPDHAPEHSSVLAEIAQLAQSGSHTDAVAHFQRYLDHPDDVVRAATVFELGELAAKRPGASAEILELLTPLGQDLNAQVRAQVVVALAKIQSVIS